MGGRAGKNVSGGGGCGKYGVGWERGDRRALKQIEERQVPVTSTSDRLTGTGRMRDIWQDCWIACKYTARTEAEG